MDREIFRHTAKICIEVFLGYILLFGIASYLDFYIKYSNLPSSFGSYYSLRFYFLPLAVPLITGYFLTRKLNNKKLNFASNFIVVAFLLLSIFWLLYSVFHSLYKPFAYQPEYIKLLDKFLEYLFFSSLSYFLFAPLSFSLWIWGRRLSLVLLFIVLMIMVIGVVGYEVIFSVLGNLPHFLALLIILILFPPISEPPIPFAMIGLIYNLFLSWRSVNKILKKVKT